MASLCSYPLHVLFPLAGMLFLIPYSALNANTTSSGKPSLNTPANMTPSHSLFYWGISVVFSIPEISLFISILAYFCLSQKR